jgi:hypothetical protein
MHLFVSTLGFHTIPTDPLVSFLSREIKKKQLLQERTITIPHQLSYIQTEILEKKTSSQLREQQIEIPMENRNVERFF